MIIVIGAGPSGLATAYYLQKRGLPFRLLEREAVGSSWQHHYDRLHLHTLKQVSGLPGYPMPEHYPEFVSKDQFLAYLKEYAQHFQFPLETGIRVKAVEFGREQGVKEGEWLVQTNQGDIRGHILILATGIWRTPVRPKLLGEENFGGCVSHAYAYRNPEPYRGQRVLVVGAGNTGTEIAIDLADYGKSNSGSSTHSDKTLSDKVLIESAISIRSGTTFIPYPNSLNLVRVAAVALRTLPKSWGEKFLQSVRADFRDIGLQPPPEPLMDAYPVVGYGLPEAIASEQVTLYGEIDHLYEGGVRFRDGREAPFDAIILATGYRPTTDFIKPYLDFTPNGWPILEKGHSTRHSRLFCVGFEYPATEGFLQSVGRAARQVVRQV